ncbi:hypothetical protein JCM8547_003300 [Rhodosporidiobolus lusitaniae]
MALADPASASVEAQAGAAQQQEQEQQRSMDEAATSSSGQNGAQLLSSSSSSSIAPSRPPAHHGSLRPPASTSSSGQFRRPRRRRTHRKFAQTWQTASFHFSLSLTLFAIALVWSITPLSWGYVLWTAFSQLGPPAHRPAPPGSQPVFTILHYLTLSYTSVEVLFSVYYRYLAYRAQPVREAPRHSRKYLRGLILRSLENGLLPEEELEDEELEKDAREREHKGSPPAAVGGNGRKKSGKLQAEEDWAEHAARAEESAGGESDPQRSPTWKRRILRRRAKDPERDGALTPELRPDDLPGTSGDDYLTARSLPTLRVDDLPMSSRASFDSRDEGYGGDGGGEKEGALSGLKQSLTRSASRLSLRTLDSAIAASPRSYTSPDLPLPLHHPPSPSSSFASTSYPPVPPAQIQLTSTSRHKHTHPFSPLLPVRLTPSDPRAVDFCDLFKFWFNNAKFEDIGKLNVADWFAWSLYGEPLEKLEKERKEWDKAGRPALYCADGTTLDTDSDLEEGDEDAPGNGEEGEGGETRSVRRRRAPALEGDKLGLVQHCISLVEARAAHRFQPGRNPLVKATRLTLDPVKVASRPLLLYGVVAALQKAVLRRAKMKGFVEGVEGDVRYAVYVPEGWEPVAEPRECERPLVFIHGLGMGAAQYATLINVLSTSSCFRTRPILILLQPAISMSFFQKGYLNSPDQERCTAGLAKVLRKYGFDERAGGVTVVSHSNGTIVHGWLVKDYSSLIARSCFVDPVCFCLWEPWVCHNFLVRKPQKPIEYLMRYFVSRELGIAVMLSRTFQWTSNLLFPSQIPSVSNPQKAAIFLASEDSILNASRMRVYLRRNGLKEVKGKMRVGEKEGGGGLKVFEGLKHGESMIGEGEAFEEVLAWMGWDEKDATAYTSSEGGSTAGEEST